MIFAYRDNNQPPVPHRLLLYNIDGGCAAVHIGCTNFVKIYINHSSFAKAVFSSGEETYVRISVTMTRHKRKTN